MTQDMKKDMILHTIGKRLVRHGRTHVRLGAHCSSLWGALRTMLLLLMMVMGTTTAWGQETDYSGTYYIKSVSVNKETADDYFLCPTEEWIYYVATNTFTETPNGQPFLTTYPCKSDADYEFRKAIWKIEKSGNYYTIKNVFHDKYVVFNGQISNAKAGRIRVHLEDVNPPSENILFVIGTNTAGKIVISPKNDSGNYFNVCQGNINDLKGSTKYNVTSKNDGPTSPTNHKNDIHGTIGLYNNKDDVNAPWSLENAKCATPTITYSNGEVTITSTEGATIYYTTDGTTIPDPENYGGENATQVYNPESKPTVSTITTIKAIAVKTKMLDSEVATLSIEKLASPSIIFDDATQTVSISGVEGATNVYTTDGNDPTPNSTVYSEAISLTGTTTVKAMTVKDGYINSDVESLTVTQLASSPSISKSGSTVTLSCSDPDATIYYTTDGTTPTQESSSCSTNTSLTLDGNQKYTIKAIAAKAGFLNSDVAEQVVDNRSSIDAPIITYTDNVVTITANDYGDEIYYTIDGTPPTTSTETHFTSPGSFNLAYGGNYTVKAIASNGVIYSSEATETIDLTNCGYSGIYYIQNNGNGGEYYMYPVGGTSTLVKTAKKTDEDAIWKIQIVGEYYHIIHYKDGKYLVAKDVDNNVMPETETVSLVTTDNPGENALFEITRKSGDESDILQQIILIRPKAAANGNGHIYLNTRGGNNGTNKIGLWDNSGASEWKLATVPAKPTFTIDDINVTISSDLGNVYYTIDGTTPTSSSTPGKNITLEYGPSYTVKAISIYHDTKTNTDWTSEIAISDPIQVDILNPIITRSENNITITNSQVSGVTFRYTFSDNGAFPEDPVPGGAGTDYTSVLPLTADARNVFKAIAYNIVDGTTYSSDVVTFDVDLRSGTPISSLADITSATGSYKLSSGFSATGIPKEGDVVIGTSTNPFKGTIDGNLIEFELSSPLFDYVQDAIIKNVIISKATISTSGNAGAIASNALGATRIYNCGVLATGSTVETDDDGYTEITSCSSTVSGSNYVGGIVGLLDGSSRVINCFSYANITGGDYRGGIVGKNNVATNATNLQTMVMNCMFYGEINTEGNPTQIAPIYGGQKITNDGDANGVNNFNYFWAGASYVQGKHINAYNCALSAETRFLQRFEFFRHLLNSNRELAAWWATDDASNKDEMMKWVMEPSQIGTSTPYPILKAPDRYPSVVNIDVNHSDTYKGDDLTIGSKFPTKLSVTIRNSTTDAVYGAPSGADITTTSLSLNITDKDPEHYNFNYYKVQLPYYNDVGIGNYTGNRVVTGWKIVEISSTSASNSFTTGTDAEAEVVADDVISLTTPYNFAERKSIQKDLYGTSNRIFNQGAYFDVPEGVTAITIEPYWGKAVYLSDAYWDVTYKNSGVDAMATAANVTTVGGGQHYNNGVSTFNGQLVYTSMGNAISSKNTGLYVGIEGDPNNQSVYDYAVVLVGNYHHKGDLEASNSKPYTVTSVDLDDDNEPDYSYILRFDSRVRVHPVRVDFLNIIGLGMAQKTTGGTGTYNLGIMQPKGWFECTNTGLFRVTQFEYDYDNSKDHSKRRVDSPIILQGGVIEQWVTVGGTEEEHIEGESVTYYHVGGNVWFKEFHIGAHQDKNLKTDKNPNPDQFVSKHPPISVTGGDFNEFYLTGLYNTPNNNYDDNAECYINGGRFGKVAGTGMQGIGGFTINETTKEKESYSNGNIIWQIDNADIDEFYAGGINAAHIAEGNIYTVISNSRVDQFCGGPKFGDMNHDKIVVTNATNCTFRAFFGAGYGGNSYNRRYPSNKNNLTSDPGWNDWVSGELKYRYNPDYSGVETRIDYQYIPMSNNTQNVARLFVDHISFSLATTYGVTSILTDCTITKDPLGRLDLFDQCLGNFYGGGSLGKVAGDVKSTLKNCTVDGNVFGAGYSASLPPVKVMEQSFVTEPRYDNNLGAYLEAKLPNADTYRWEHRDVVNSKETAIDTERHILYTEEDLNTLGQVLGNVTLNITGTTLVKGMVEEEQTGGVYGGGDSSAALGNTEVNINASGVKNNSDKNYNTYNVFGGGNLADVGGSVTVNLTNGVVKNDVYGGGALANTNNYDLTTYEPVDVTVGETVVTGLYTETGGEYTLIETANQKAENGVTYYRNGWVGTLTNKTTTVNLLGGKIHGDAYGGGLGRIAESVHYTQKEADAYNTEHNLSSGDEGFKTVNDWQPEVEATVYGDINVNLGSNEDQTATAFYISNYDDDDHSTVVKSGRVFGCNNLNGSPQGDVRVTVYKTVTGNVSRTAHEQNNEQRPQTGSGVTPTYEVAAVYGGGNLANYTTTGKKAYVKIMKCDVSIRSVYGGGNAAAVPETDVLVNGAYEIGEVFGGGNGKDSYTLDGNTWTVNPGANVNGNATTLLKGGYIHEAYGGSNSRGTISGNVSIDKSSGGDCTLTVEDLYGAGKDADIEGDLIMVMGCSESRTEKLYGCSKNANVKGNVELTITSGEYGQVFGGNNESGAIFGHIIVNIEEVGCSPIIIDELYGCGNNAAYSVYGYYHAQKYVDGDDMFLDKGKTIPLYEYASKLYQDKEHTKRLYIDDDDKLYIDEGMTRPLYMPRTSADDQNKVVIFENFPHTVLNGTTDQYDDPQVNIISCTRIGKVFGGGLGDGAAVYGNPKVNINMIPGRYAADELGGANKLGAVGSGYEKNSEPVEGGVFGAGNEAAVYGNTTVNIGTETTVYVVVPEDDITVGTTDVSSYYTYSEASYEAASGTAVEGTTYYELNETTGEYSEVVDVEVGDDVTDYYTFNPAGYETVSGTAVAGTTYYVQSDVLGANIAGNVYGGGNLANVGHTVLAKDKDGNDIDDIKMSCNTSVNICVNNNGESVTFAAPGVTIAGNVFGGGKGEAINDNSVDAFRCGKAMVTGNTNVIIGNGTVNGSVYGGGEVGRVEVNTAVTIGLEFGENESPSSTNNAPVITGNVFGAGAGVSTHGYSALVRGDSHVTIQGNAKVEKSVYGGGEKASVGRHKVVNGIATDVLGGGDCVVTIRDYAEIGTDDMVMINSTTNKPDDWGHVFGAGKGVLPYEGVTSGNPWSTVPGNSIEYTSANESNYFKYINTLGLANDTEVTIGGHAFVKGSVYGGSENGHVQGNTHVTIQDDCQIGNGYVQMNDDGEYLSTKRGVNRRYTDAEWAEGHLIIEGDSDTELVSVVGTYYSSSLPECASWVFDGSDDDGEEPYKPYDVYDYVDATAENPVPKPAKDGHTFFGNVFGGGSGYFPYRQDPDYETVDQVSGKSKKDLGYGDGLWHREAGSVSGNTVVDITGGHILTSVYGGNEQTDVTGTCTINMIGGTVGVPRTVEQAKKHPVTCYVFGAGKGDPRINFNTWTNVSSTQVNITNNARIYGSTFGGGEDGHVIGDAETNIGGTVTIGNTPYTYPEIDQDNSGVIIGTTGTSAVDGNIFGGGRGFSETALTAGVVGGNVRVNIHNGKMLGSVFGGGRLASVGTYFADAGSSNYGMMQDGDNHGIIRVNIDGGIIGATGVIGADTDNGVLRSSDYSIGDVFGGCKGSSTNNLDFGLSKHTYITMTGGKVNGSVYGGGEVAMVEGDTDIKISGGYVGDGVTEKGGAKIGNVYGGGKGNTDAVMAGLIKGNTNVTISNTLADEDYAETHDNVDEGDVIAGPTIYHNVYGGGAYGSVGTYTYDSSTSTTTCASGTGKAEVIITGGVIGIDGNNNGMVFGSSRGDVATPTGSPAVDVNDRLAWVNDTHVVIGNSEGGPSIKGSVYGSGENGHVFTNTVIDVHGGTIGIDDDEDPGYSVTITNDDNSTTTYEGANYPNRGNVYGGGCGTDTYKYTYSEKYDSNNDGIIDENDGERDVEAKAYNPLAGVVLGNATVNIDGGLVVHNVYGAGAMGSVGTISKSTTENDVVVNTITSGGTTTINISGGTVGVNGNENGNVFGAARGDVATTQKDVALVKTTNVTISGADTMVKGNVYGGGETGDVGTYTTDDEDTNTYLGESGVCNVTVSGGTIGHDGNGNGNVFGAGKGDASTFKCMKAMVKETHVSISNGLVKGNVYGGGELGRVEYDTHVTIGTESGSNTPEIIGCVFGAGAGVETHGYSALVRGNANVKVQGYAKVRQNVYGGGQIATVGRYRIAKKANMDDPDFRAAHPGIEIGMPYENRSGGTCTVIVKGHAAIGPESGNATDNAGHVFGAGKGVNPFDAAHDDINYEDAEDPEPDKNTKPRRMTPIPDDLPSLWEPVEGADGFIWEYYTSQETYFRYLETQALASWTDVTIEGNATVMGSVYGGSESGFVQDDTDVEIKDRCVIGTTGATQYGRVYGGGKGLSGFDDAGRVGDETKVTTTGGTIYGSVFGGGELGIVKNSVAVNISGGEVKQDVYGGGALANTNTACLDDIDKKGIITTVNLTSGIIEGDVYGGGLGQKVPSVIEAIVGGDVFVNLNGGEASTDENNCVVKGRIFGCNNLRGTPRGNVTVHVYSTENWAGHEKNANKNNSTYNVEAVYGGGNEAAYEPTDAHPSSGTYYSYDEANGVYTRNDNNGTTYEENDLCKAHVIIDGCGLSSIKWVYGGGNSAPTPATSVTVNGCYEIGTVFGGGNGADRLGDGSPNLGANVGYRNYSYVDGGERKDYDNADTKENRRANYRYGTGKAETLLYGGTIHNAFGGSNMLGNVCSVAFSALDQKSDCDLIVGELYGAGNQAFMDAKIELDMGCVAGLSELYGGAYAATVNEDVHLKLTSGRYDKVFGGNNQSGTINGSITVDIEETGCYPIIIGQLYGGGNLAAYPGVDAAGDFERKITLNVKSFTSIGTIFGGGYGRTAIVTGDTYVNVNEYNGLYYDKSTTTDQTKNISGESVFIPGHKCGKIGTIGNIFGGGNAADVIGDTHINIGTEEALYEPVVLIVPGETDVSDYYTKDNSNNYTRATGVAQDETDYYQQIVKMAVENYRRVSVSVGADVSSYYIRSGEGTASSPYDYTPATGTAENGIDYYEKVSPNNKVVEYVKLLAVGDDVSDYYINESGTSATGTAVAGTTYYEKNIVKGADIRLNVYGGGNDANVKGNTHVEIGRASD